MRCHRSLISTTSVAVCVGALVAGCGGGSPRTVSAPSNSGLGPLVAYARCMRSHGVPNFPDPTVGEGIDKDKVIAALRTPRSGAAQSACQHLQPATGLAPPNATQPTRSRLADALAFARCVRNRGVPSFPDPTPQGILTVEMVQAQGIDVRSPSVLHAVYTCLPASRGALNAAKIREALSHAGG